MSPAVALFQQLDEMIGRGHYGDAAGVRAELKARFGFDVAWRPSPAGPVAEVVETGVGLDRAPSPMGENAVERDPEMTQATRGVAAPDGPHGSVAVPAAPQPRQHPSAEGVTSRESSVI